MFKLLINKKIVINLLYLILFVFVFLLFASRFTFKFPLTPSSYYNFLADSFLNGKVNITRLPVSNMDYGIYKAPLDVSIYKGKVYLYWGPMPAIVLMPFIKVFGVNFSDIFYTAVIGAINCFLLMIILEELSKSGIIKLNKTLQIILILFFTFGSSNFILALTGHVWWTGHTFAVFFLLLTILFLIKYYRTKKVSYLILTSLFYGCSFLTKQNMLFSIIFIFFLIKKVQPNIKKFLQTMIIFIILPFIFGVFYLGYNYLRFNNVWETGFSYQNFHLKHLKFVNIYGRLNIAYLPRNIYYNFLNPLNFEAKFPFIKPDKSLDGSSIFLTCPLLFLWFFINKNSKNEYKQKTFFYLGALLSSILIIFPSLLNHGTGGDQITPRFFSDIFPFIIFLLIPVIKHTNIRISILLTGLAIIFQQLSYYWWTTNIFYTFFNL